MIHTNDLSRSFRTKHGAIEAVRELRLDIAEGELVGFLGPNGAGKTTTLRMLTTLLPPSSGNATVAGHDLRSDPVGVRRDIGYVAQTGSAGDDRLVAAELRMQGRFHGQRADRAEQRCWELLRELELTELSDRPIGTLSGGQRRRLDVALGLMHTPRLLFLDEPSTGLDPQSRAHLWDHIRTLRARHRMTVLLSTHYLDEADALCDRLLIIDHGRVVAAGKPDELKQRISGEAVEFSSPSPSDAATAVNALPDATEIVVTGDTVSFRTARADAVLQPLLRAMDEHGVTLTALRVQRPSLDDVFLELTGRSLREVDVAA